MEEESQFGVSDSSSRPPARAIQPPSHHVLTLTFGHRHARFLRHRPVLSYHLFFTFLICCAPICSASLYIKEQMVEATDVHESPASTLARLAKSGVILVDQSEPPKPLDWTLAAAADDLRRRDDPFGNDSGSGSSSQSASPKTSTKYITSSILAPTPTSSSGGIATATMATSQSPLPIPFDSGFSANISASCAGFMQNMLGNSTFQQCLPFSLLLQNSISFFQAEKSLVRISQTLDATCSANVTTCSKLMATFASNLTQATSCASDLTSQNPLIQQARLGLLAYKPMYQASCLKNPSTNLYCFAEAITNSSSPSDNYIYYLPLNITLPGGSLPTCSSCLQSTMAVFEAASADRTSALASDYVSAASQVNVNCGPNFVNASLPAPVAAGAPSLAFPSSNAGLLALVLVVASWLL